VPLALVLAVVLAFAHQPRFAGVCVVAAGLLAVFQFARNSNGADEDGGGGTLKR
jgi:hypothetical protein